MGIQKGFTLRSISLQCISHKETHFFLSLFSLLSKTLFARLCFLLVVFLVVCCECLSKVLFIGEANQVVLHASRHLSFAFHATHQVSIAFHASHQVSLALHASHQVCTLQHLTYHHMQLPTFQMHVGHVDGWPHTMRVFGPATASRILLMDSAPS